MYSDSPPLYIWPSTSLLFFIPIHIPLFILGQAVAGETTTAPTPPTTGEDVLCTCERLAFC